MVSGIKKLGKIKLGLILLFISCKNDQILIPGLDQDKYNINPDLNRNQINRPLLHIFYLEPVDQRVDDKTFMNNTRRIKKSVKQVQVFFADQMKFNNHGRKSFKVRKDIRFNQFLIQRVSLPQTLDFYINQKNVKSLISQHTDEIFGPIHNNKINEIRLFFIDFDGRMIESCGFGSGYRSSGHSFIMGHCWNNNTLIHELGHAFGLHHDFRNDSYMMSYGGVRRNRLSPGACYWLDRHPAFNDILYDPDFRPMIINLKLESIDHRGDHRYHLCFKFDSPFYDEPLNLYAVLLDRTQKYPEVVEFVTPSQFRKQTDSSYKIRITGNMPNNPPKQVELQFINQQGQSGKAGDLWPE